MPYIIDRHSSSFSFIVIAPFPFVPSVNLKREATKERERKRERRKKERGRERGKKERDRKREREKDEKPPTKNS